MLLNFSHMAIKFLIDLYLFNMPIIGTLSNRYLHILEKFLIHRDGGHKTARNTGIITLKFKILLNARWRLSYFIGVNNVFDGRQSADEIIGKLEFND